MPLPMQSSLLGHRPQWRECSDGFSTDTTKMSTEALAFPEEEEEVCCYSQPSPAANAWPAEKLELYKKIKDLYPHLDRLMAEAAVDLYLAHPDEDVDTLLADVPPDYFLTKHTQEEKDGPSAGDPPGSPARPEQCAEGQERSVHQQLCEGSQGAPSTGENPHTIRSALL